MRHDWWLYLINYPPLDSPKTVNFLKNEGQNQTDVLVESHADLDTEETVIKQAGTGSSSMNLGNMFPACEISRLKDIKTVHCIGHHPLHVETSPQQVKAQLNRLGVATFPVS